MRQLVTFHFVVVKFDFWPLGTYLDLYFYLVNSMVSSDPAILWILNLHLHPVALDLLIWELGCTWFGLLAYMLSRSTFSPRHQLKTFDGSSYLWQSLVFYLENWTFSSHLTAQNCLWCYQLPICLDRARAWMVDSKIYLCRCLDRHSRGCLMLRISWVLLSCRLEILLLFGCWRIWSRSYRPFSGVPLHSGLPLPWNSSIAWKVHAWEVFLSSRWRFHWLGGLYFTVFSVHGLLNMAFDSASRPLVCFHPGWRPRGSSAFLALRSFTCCLGYSCRLDVHLRQRVDLRAGVTEEIRVRGLSLIWRHHRVFVKCFWS